MMLVVGLTGGIGSGKTTVAHLFAELGIPIIDADVIAREVTKPGSPALLNIIDHFEEELLLGDGSLDRAALRQIIFTNAEQRRWLEDLLHPMIQAEIEKHVKQQSAPYVIVAIPLLLEVEPYPIIDRVLVVDATEQAQIDRVIKRDKHSTDQVKAIMKTQLARPLRLSQADDVIKNEGSLDDLKAEVRRLHDRYMAMATN